MRSRSNIAEDIVKPVNGANAPLVESLGHTFACDHRGDTTAVRGLGSLRSVVNVAILPYIRLSKNSDGPSAAFLLNPSKTFSIDVDIFPPDKIFPIQLFCGR